MTWVSRWPSIHAVSYRRFRKYSYRMEGSGSDTVTSTTDTRYREAGKDIAKYERQRQAQSCGHRKTERGGTEETERQT